MTDLNIIFKTLNLPEKLKLFEVDEQVVFPVRKDNEPTGEYVVFIVAKNYNESEFLGLPNNARGVITISKLAADVILKV